MFNMFFLAVIHVFIMDREYLSCSVSVSPSFSPKRNQYMGRDMRFPKMWYVQPAKPQISLRLRAVASRLNILRL